MSVSEIVCTLRIPTGHPQLCYTSHLPRRRSTEGADRCLNVMGLPRDTVESLVTRLQNLTRKEFKRILESEAHPCKRFLEKPVDHGHNLRSCKTNPAHLRIPVSRTVRHKQSFIPRGAKLNLIWYVYIICSVLSFYCNMTVILIAKGNIKVIIIIAKFVNVTSGKLVNCHSLECGWVLRIVGLFVYM